MSLVTSADCWKKYGNPFKEKSMTLWVVPNYLHIGPVPKKIYCNKDIIVPLTNAFENVLKEGISDQIKTWDGCFNIRSKRGAKSMSLHCIPAGEPVWTKNGIIDIENVKVGDKVLSYNEETKELEEKFVINTFINGEKNILKLNIRNYNIKCSEDHEIMVLKKTTLDKKNWIKNPIGRGHQKAIYKTELIKAKDLKKGEKIVVLKNANNIQHNDETNLDWFEILGLYIGDGCFHNRKNSNYNYVSFSIPKEDRIRDHTKDLLERYFCCVKENEKTFFIYRKQDYEVFRKYNYKAWDKFIPEEVFNASIEQKLSFIKGLLYSDGYTLKSYNKNNKDIFTLKYSIKSASKKLIEDLKLLCSLVGIKTSNITFNKPESKIINGVNCASKGSYCISMSDYNKLIQLDADNIYNERQINSSDFKTYGSPCFGYEHVGNQFTIESLSSIEEIGREDTYDIEVEDNHLFILNGVVVSNSWGIAIDINAAWNRFGKKPTMSKELVDCFVSAGFSWGGYFKTPDGMHFQLAKI